VSHAAEKASPAAGSAPAGATSTRRRSLRGSPGLTLISAALGVMMVAIDGTIVAVANPAIQSHLGASLSDIQWVTNGYLLALAITLITIGKIGDRFGPKKVFITASSGSLPPRPRSACPAASRAISR
jgi:MFS family permease